MIEQSKQNEKKYKIYIKSQTLSLLSLLNLNIYIVKKINMSDYSNEDISSIE